MKEIKAIADQVLGNEHADAQHLRKALRNISNLAWDEITNGELPMKGER